MEILILVVAIAIGWAIYKGYRSGEAKGYTDGLTVGGKTPALGQWTEFVQNPEKFMKPSKPRVGQLFETPEEVMHQFGGDENKMPWMEFVRRYNAALKRAGRDAEQIEAIPRDIKSFVEVLAKQDIKFD